MALDKLKVTVLYDSTDEPPKPPADPNGKPEKLTSVQDQIADALTKRGHTVTLLAADRKIRSLSGQLEKDQSDIIFNICESLGGFNQHEQHVASLLELFGKAFTGSTALGLTLAQDKGLAKKLFNFHGLPYPKFSIMEAGKLHWSDELQFPLIVKPLNEDASIGIDNKAIVNTVKELFDRMSYIHTEIGSAVLVEEYIDGREIYVGVIGTQRPEALPIIKWDFSKLSPTTPRIASSEAKWDEDSEGYKAPEVFPTDIPPEVYREIQNTAVTAFKALHLSGYGRVDLRLRPPPLIEVPAPPQPPPASSEVLPGVPVTPPAPSTVKIYDPNGKWEFFIIEVNPNPYLERRAELACAARKSGMKFPQMLESVLEQGLKDSRLRKGKKER